MNSRYANRETGVADPVDAPAALDHEVIAGAVRAAVEDFLFDNPGVVSGAVRTAVEGFLTDNPDVVGKHMASNTGMVSDAITAGVDNFLFGRREMVSDAIRSGVESFLTDNPDDAFRRGVGSG